MKAMNIMKQLSLPVPVFGICFLAAVLLMAIGCEKVKSDDSDSKYVDLGLSVKWATCNLGASSPEEMGTYFAFGDVLGQTWDGSSWSGDGFCKSWTYELESDKSLKLKYDAAYFNLHRSWRMPTFTECQELLNNTIMTWTSNYNGTGVSGAIFTSTVEGYTDKSIFLPAAGYGWYDKLQWKGTYGYYWLSCYGYDSCAWSLVFHSNGFSINNHKTNRGLSVRAVME